MRSGNMGIYRNRYTHVFAYLLIGISIIYGIHVRYMAVTHTEIYLPIRADAFDYYNYAANLARWGIFSKQKIDKDYKESPKPDALRSIGFPAFASLFASEDTKASVQNVLIAQTLVQIVCFTLLSVVILKLLGVGWGVLAIFLLWSFPHFVSINTYYLTESLFTSVLALTVFSAWYFSDKQKFTLAGLIVCGLLIGVASLVRPVIQYFPFFVLLLSVFFYRKELPKALIFVGCALAPVLLWKLRNIIVIGVTSDPTLMINALYHGSFPGFMYNNDPSSFGFPYRFDPRAQEYYEGVGVTLGLIWERALNSPLEYINWYLLGKQNFLWQWSIVSGQGDIFIYPIIKVSLL